MAKFNPIRTESSKVASIPVTDGNFIFCTDNGEIFIDAAYGSPTVSRRQGFPKYTRRPVELILESGTQSGLDMIGDTNDPIVPNTIVFVKEVESYFYFDATSEAEPNGETIIKPEYIASGAGRWIGFTTNGITPHIDESTGNWFLGLVNTGKPARGPQGHTPVIGVNGNWFINDVDTNKPSTGTTPHIQNGYWYLGDTNTNVKAEGEDGATPTISGGYWHINGVSTGIRAEGEDGATPTISGGYWYINGVSTGIRAQGQDGTTPTIDPTTKNWMFGSQDSGVCAEGKDGSQITIDNDTKNWKIDGADTGVRAEGRDGTGFIYRGIFDQSASPAYGVSNGIADTVSYDGNLWAYINATPSNNPPPDLPAISNAYWALVLEKGSGGGGGSPYYLDTLEDLYYVPERTNALRISISSKPAMSGVYSQFEGTTGTSRKWRYIATPNQTAYRLSYQSDKWYITQEEYWEEEWHDSWSEGAVYSESNPSSDPWLVQNWYTEDWEGGDSIPETVYMVKLQDSEELVHGLASLGSSDEPLLDGCRVYVTSEHAFYRFENESTAVLATGTIIKPDYVTGAGRWIKDSVTNTGETVAQPTYSKVQLVSNTLGNDANVYFPFCGHIANLGSDKRLYLNCWDIESNGPNSTHYYDNAKFRKALKAGPIEGIDYEFVRGVAYQTYTMSIFFMVQNTSFTQILDSPNNIQIAVKNGFVTLGMITQYNGQYETILTNPVLIKPNIWYHVAVIHTDGTSQLYVDGIGCASPATNKTPYNYSLFQVRDYSNFLAVEEYVIYDKVIYTGNFTPPTAPLEYRTTPVSIVRLEEPTSLPDIVNPDAYITPLIQAAVTLDGGDTYRGARQLLPNKRYNLMARNNVPAFIPTGFTPRKIEKTEIWEYKLPDKAGVIPSDKVTFTNGFSETTAKTDNKVNMFEIRSNGAAHALSFTITKLGEYTPKYMLYRYNDATPWAADIINPNSLQVNVVDRTMYHIGGPPYSCIFRNPISNRLLHNGTVDYYGDTYAIVGGKLLGTKIGGSGNFRIVDDNVHWTKAFVDANGEIAIAGILLGNNKLYSLSTNSVVLIDDQHIWVDIVADYWDYVSKSRVYAIDNNGHLYHGSNIHQSQTLTKLDDTRRWSMLSADSYRGLFTTNPIGIADGKLFVINTSDNSFIEVDAGGSDVMVSCSSPSVSGIYTKNSETLYSRSGGSYYLILMSDDRSSYNNHWVISSINDFSNLEEWDFPDEYLIFAKQSAGGSPHGSDYNSVSWDPELEGTTATVGDTNTGWVQVVGSMKAYGQNPYAIAVKQDGTCRYIKWDTASTIVTAPIEIDGTANTSPGWSIGPNRVLGKVMYDGELYAVDYSGAKPSIASASAINDVVSYAENEYVKLNT